MTEIVVPGTYITVRPEGLISAGRVATGIVRIIGTAAKGRIGKPVTLSGLADAREEFGPPDRFDRPEDGSNPLTLVRALEYVYNNGAASVIAVRVAGPSQSSASFEVQNANGQAVAVLRAKSPGTWAKDTRITIEQAEDPCRVEDETHTDAFDELDHASIRPSRENRILITRGGHQANGALNVVYRLTVREEEVRSLDLRTDGGALDLESNGGDVFINNNILPVRIRNLQGVSSRELKENILDFSAQEAIEALEDLNPVLFNWRDGEEKKLRLGFIAEDTPEIATNPDKTAIIPMHILAILSRVLHEQQRSIDCMRRELGSRGARTSDV